MSYALRRLRECGPLPGRPDFIPKAKLRGTRARGITFERKVGVVLRKLYPHKVYSGRWFHYEDSRKRGCCQVDHYVLLSDKILLVECKLTETDEAWSQMSALYAPILEQHYDLPVARVQATRYLRSQREPLLELRLAPVGEESLWQVLA